MPYILVYEPKEGLRYWVQREPGNWRLTGLIDNACQWLREDDAKTIADLLKWDLKIVEYDEEDYPKSSL